MSPQALLQHELQVRGQVIKDLQQEKERMVQMLNRATGACQRLRDEVLFVTMQTHAIVKSIMLMTNQHDLQLTPEMLTQAREWVLEKGAAEGLTEGTLAFNVREMTSEEKEKEQSLRKKVENAERRIKEQ